MADLAQRKACLEESLKHLDIDYQNQLNTQKSTIDGLSNDLEYHKRVNFEIDVSNGEVHGLVGETNAQLNNLDMQSC